MIKSGTSGDYINANYVNVSLQLLSFYYQNASGFDQEVPQSQTTDQPTAPLQRDT